ncbi:thiamine pyrophosphate-binding protein [Anaerovorax odorimutans]|uniref:Thiamine pyrophosphate-binding protein n=1 Tax=Anaerovorax odorimutans TaxID=109327 RepID=A0ABT1RNP7_9FIRM|nr:thiamine pyrophosphate-binding protein [Anaerovorax odorimutans]MCQ4636813.1 thiamine pyrophosphate-binding protein [Anaerovorax odorimutans]
MSEKMPGYQFIAGTLKGYGLTHIFYVEAMLRMVNREFGEMDVTRIMAHSENAAAYMADGYARMAGKPGVCMSQSIGSANLAGGIHEAWLANSPVIAFTGKKPPTYQYRGCYQEADHCLLYEGITKFNADVSESEQLPTVLRQCFRAAVTGKPRPVHADLSNHTGRVIEVGSVSQPIAIESRYSQYPPFRPAAEQSDVALAAEEIHKAARPVIVLGRGASLSGAGKEAVALAEKADIPVVTSPDGKALIDEQSELWCGIVGEYGMDCANRTVMDADLVIFVGTQTGDQTTLSWKVPAQSTRVIQIDIDPLELGKNYPNSVNLLGDAKIVLGQLLAETQENGRPAWRKTARGYVVETLKEYEEKQNRSTLPMRPERLCLEISKALPDDAVLVADTGYSAVWSSTMLRMKPSQKYLRAAGSLGWSYPASLGVKCAAPDRPVICFTGDGAFYYHLNEMETAARNGINTVTIINNNMALVQCRPDLSLVYKDQMELIHERYEYPDIDFAKIAETYGCWSRRVDKPEDVGPAIRDALAAGRPAVLDVRTERAAEIPQALIPR